ncbi:MAG: VWA domain-containing protein [Acidobacteriaceae bacterium]
MKTKIATLSRTLLLFSLAVPALAIHALAQQPAAPARQPILLDVLVTKSNKPVPNLKQQDFTILDDGQPANILLFHPHNIADVPANEVDASTTIIILIDQVNTPFNDVTYIRQGIQQYLRQNNGSLNHPVTLAFFTEKGLQMQTQPSIDGNALSAALDKQVQGFRIIQDSTQYGGSQRMALSLDALQNLVDTEKTRPGRKLVLWVSPGWPYLNGPEDILTAGQQQQTLSTAIRLSTGLRQARITLDSIDPQGAGEHASITAYLYKDFLNPLTDPSKAHLGNLNLRVIAAQSGGRVFEGNNLVLNELNDATDDLNAFYTIEIPQAPSTHPNQFHTIEIKLPNPKLKVITRNGYYGN